MDDDSSRGPHPLAPLPMTLSPAAPPAPASASNDTPPSENSQETAQSLLLTTATATPQGNGRHNPSQDDSESSDGEDAQGQHVFVPPSKKPIMNVQFSALSGKATPLNVVTSSSLNSLPSDNHNGSPAQGTLLRGGKRPNDESSPSGRVVLLPSGSTPVNQTPSHSNLHHASKSAASSSESLGRGTPPAGSSPLTKGSNVPPSPGLPTALRPDAPSPQLPQAPIGVITQVQQPLPKKSADSSSSSTSTNSSMDNARRRARIEAIKNQKQKEQEALNSSSRNNKSDRSTDDQDQEVPSGIKSSPFFRLFSCCLPISMGGRRRLTRKNKNRQGGESTQAMIQLSSTTPMSKPSLLKKGKKSKLNMVKVTLCFKF